MSKKISIIKPDDWHLHLRDGDALNTTVAFSAKQFQRAIVMPNLAQAIVNTELALQYRQRIINARPEGNNFQPLMTIYLTELRISAALATTSLFLRPSYTLPAQPPTHQTG